jgi:hypothetical protein
MKSRRMPHGRVLELQNSVSQFMVHASANETNRRAFKNSTCFERMKDFSNASFPPDTIEVMTLAMNGGSLHFRIRSAQHMFNRSLKQFCAQRRKANETQRF